MNENTCPCGSNCQTIVAKFNRPDGKAGVRGRWKHRGGCLYLGEVTVLIAGRQMSFSSTTPQTDETLAGYATDEYLARHADRFRDNVRYA